ncbi:hypothetical protein M8994_22235, partial [Brucella sp. 21LCYQ03]|nr:hypothetical protein [Brucella sp. 21LCYQ03]
NGYLIDESNVAGMAAQLVKLIRDPALRIHLGKNAAQMAHNYAEDKIMNQWLSLFEDVLRVDKDELKYKSV